MPLILLGGYLAACGAVSGALHTSFGWPIDGHLIGVSMVYGAVLTVAALAWTAVRS